MRGSEEKSARGAGMVVVAGAVLRLARTEEGAGGWGKDSTCGSGWQQERERGGRGGRVGR
jgi:hypothetical protein